MLFRSGLERVYPPIPPLSNTVKGEVNSVQIIKRKTLGGRMLCLSGTSYFKNDGGCNFFRSLPKCNCHLLPERCITIWPDLKIRHPHGGEQAPPHSRPHIRFYFPINSCPSRQEFHISKLKCIFGVAVISGPVLF